jgi:hypothetical protein
VSTRPVTVATLDYAGPGVPLRMEGLAAVSATDHLVHWRPVLRPRTGLARYVDGLLESGDPDLPQVLLVTNCAAVGLAGLVCRAVSDAGGEVVHLLAVDPVALSAEAATEAVDEVLRQVHPGGLAGMGLTVPTAVGVGVGFADVCDEVSVQLRALVRTALEGATEPLGPPTTASAGSEHTVEAVTDALMARYNTWLQYLLACYAGNAMPLGPVGVTALCTDGGPPEWPEVWRPVAARAATCPHSGGGCVCLADLVDEVVKEYR